MNAQKILGIVVPKLKEPSVCESCGDEFACGASIKGCWCMKVELTDESRENLKAKFEDCLCPNCLNAYSDPKPSESTSN